ncbi:formylmethanofuran dehydrogenase subunit B protein (plasmid) [Rhizobium etli 8C-3]|uniref:Formylmethanofuran dehydrogenase subunit B n=2 Tax=Rhizobium TaxID=379 RepID=A0A4V2VBG5_9HYPH|nr:MULTISPECIES: tungsten formylmethanofuran dehydrogenase [Rhizobium]APO78383.1 formylmethanofuran dehydrogenase subunit B protein [Rhizobium etli 8C-3]TCU24825.1 formylmethanofuran dehydrogenase subunit B [Rhizobium azibense]TCU39571.1 formylmethanofuran dehydrogenase subunit B [Rhizobium azibense]
MVAWIGSQTVPLPAAIEQVAKLLAKSRCPVFSIESDVHGTRSLIALAERVGATYDHVNGRNLLHEVALHTDIGGFFATATEVRRRADLVIIVGDIPAAHHDLLSSLASTAADLTSSSRRRWLRIKGKASTALGDPVRRVKAVEVGSSDFAIDAVLASLRAILAGRKASAPLANVDSFLSEMASARFPVFVFSHLNDPASLGMLQGMLADINRARRATALFLPSDDDAWGMVLASAWMTGFPPRTGFSTGSPIHDPWLCDIERMIAEGEADLHLFVSERDEARPSKRSRVPTIALVRSERPAAGALVTVRIGKAGLDHDGVVYSSRIGTLRSVAASVPSALPSISNIVGQLQHALQEEGLPS